MLLWRLSPRVKSGSDSVSAFDSIAGIGENGQPKLSCKVFVVAPSNLSEAKLKIVPIAAGRDQI